MNLDKYEKINGREALKRLADGERIYLSGVGKVNFQITEYNDIYREETVDGIKKDENVYIDVTDVLKNDWYIPKPFDVRQAMRDKPDEWVAAYQDEEGRWWKFGFETEAFQTLAIPFNINTKLPLYETYRKNGNWTIVLRKALDACIPIEDVPEEETR